MAALWTWLAFPTENTDIQVVLLFLKNHKGFFWIINIWRHNILMNSSRLFRTHRGQARLRSKANIFHINVYREKGEAVMKARPCWTQTRRSGASRSADKGPDCGPRSRGPWPRWSPSTSFLNKGSASDDHAGPLPRRQEPREGSGWFSTGSARPSVTALVTCVSLPSPCWFEAS